MQNLLNACLLSWRWSAQGSCQGVVGGTEEDVYFSGINSLPKKMSQMHWTQSGLHWKIECHSSLWSSCKTFWTCQNVCMSLQSVVSRIFYSLWPWTLTFWPPKSEASVSVPKCINAIRLVKICRHTFQDITLTTFGAHARTQEQARKIMHLDTLRGEEAQNTESPVRVLTLENKDAYRSDHK